MSRSKRAPLPPLSPTPEPPSLGPASEERLPSWVPPEQEFLPETLPEELFPGLSDWKVDFSDVSPANVAEGPWNPEEELAPHRGRFDEFKIRFNDPETYGTLHNESPPEGDIGRRPGVGPSPTERSRVGQSPTERSGVGQSPTERSGVPETKAPRPRRAEEPVGGVPEDLRVFDLFVDPARPLLRNAPFERFDPNDAKFQTTAARRRRVLDVSELKNRNLAVPGEINPNFFYMTDGQSKTHPNQLVRIIKPRFITAPKQGRAAAREHSHGKYTFECQIVNVNEDGQLVSTGERFSTYFIDATQRQHCDPSECSNPEQAVREKRQARLVRTPTPLEEKGPTPCEERLDRVVQLLKTAIHVATA